MTQPPTTATDSAGVAAVIVLAAGGGTRMKSATSKLLHEVAGRSMLSYAVSAAQAVAPEHLVVVVGHHREQVLEHLNEIAPHVATAVQDQQLGTGHATQAGLQVLPELTGEVLVTYGDVPMLTGDTLQQLVAAHREAQSAITVLTAHVPDPFGYGRVVRDGAGQVEAIIEQRDATPEQAAIDEINSGIYVFDAATLTTGLSQIRADNAQGELLLTDVVAITRGAGGKVGAFTTDDLWQTEGVNDRVQLAKMNAEMNRRIVENWMREGVTVLDPATTWIEDDVTLATDVTLLPGVHLQGATTIGEGAQIGPDTTIKDSEVDAGAIVVRSHLNLVSIGEHAEIGPYAHLRPDTEVEAKADVGAFVETLHTRIGPGAKVGPVADLSDQVVEGSAAQE